jgi:hypothetical protein
MLLPWKTALNKKRMRKRTEEKKATPKEMTLKFTGEVKTGLQ